MKKGDANETKRTRKMATARSPETREKQLINLAYNEAEQRIKNGTATSQLLTFFLKLGTAREKMEMKRLESDLRVAEAKIRQMDSQNNLEELFAKAITAMKRYGGDNNEDEYDDDYDEEL